MSTITHVSLDDLVRVDSGEHTPGRVRLSNAIVTTIGERVTVRDLDQSFQFYEVDAAHVTKRELPDGPRDGLVTELDYMYRDASNYKQYTSVVLAGVITVEQVEKILGACKNDYLFVPELLELENPRDNNISWYDDDGSWCEITGFVIRDSFAEPEETIAAFADRFSKTRFTKKAAAESLRAFKSERPRGR